MGAVFLEARLAETIYEQVRFKFGNFKQCKKARTAVVLLAMKPAERLEGRLDGR